MSEEVEAIVTRSRRQSASIVQMPRAHLLATAAREHLGYAAGGELLHRYLSVDVSVAAAGPA
jgi:hypothetical protein